jgi:transposase
VHRHKRVQTLTRVKNQLHALAMNQGLRLRWQLWSREGLQQLEGLPLLPYASARRTDLLRQLEEMEAEIEKLDKPVRQEAESRPEARRLMSHPGVGPVTALAYVLTLGDVRRFEHARQVASYLGLIPSEESSGGKQRLGHISKQGNPLMRFLLVEAGHSAVRKDGELARCYSRLKHRHSTGVAKVAVARKLALRLYSTPATKTCRRGPRLDAAQPDRLCAAPGSLCRQARVIPWSENTTGPLSGQPASPAREGRSKKQS